MNSYQQVTIKRKILRIVGRMNNESTKFLEKTFIVINAAKKSGQEDIISTSKQWNINY